MVCRSLVSTCCAWPWWTSGTSEMPSCRPFSQTRLASAIAASEAPAFAATASASRSLTVPRCCGQYSTCSARSASASVTASASATASATSEVLSSWISITAVAPTSAWPTSTSFVGPACSCRSKLRMSAPGSQHGSPTKLPTGGPWYGADKSS